MKLVVTIPAYNEETTIAQVIEEIPRFIMGIDQVEVLVLDDGSTDGTVHAAFAAGADYVISNGRNRGLAATFKRALQEALARGADIIVNTDGDNHYDQSRIPDLIQPLLRHQADLVIGNRNIDELPMSIGNKYGNKLGNLVMQRLLGLPRADVSSGFRAYTREAALRLNVLSSHTYTHETLFNALDQRLAVVSLPLRAREVTRPSRLIHSIPSHVWNAGLVILRALTLYRPLQVYATVGVLFALLGLIPFVRFLWFYVEGNGSGHIQSLVIGGALWFLGIQCLVVALLASAIRWNRRLIEETLVRLKHQQAEQWLVETQPAVTPSGNGDHEPEPVEEELRAA
jgi:glycosyltransferase involved in cell wall biosynthesis